MTGAPTPLRMVSPPRFRLLFFVWTALGLLAFARYLLLSGSPKQNLLPELFGWLSCYYSWLLLTPLLFRLERKFPLEQSWPHVVALAGIGLPISYVAYEITLLLNVGLQLLRNRSPLLPARWWVFPTREFALEQALYWFTVLGASVIRKVSYLRAQERLAVRLAIEKAELETCLRHAELESLRMRLNPHFLFNCLQTISSLSQTDPKMAGLMIKRLGDILRVALRHQTRAESTLESELAMADAYLAIEQIRFEDRLSVSRDIEAGTENALVPTFLLQPLLENAIKHGLRTEKKAGLIRIKSSRDSSQLVLAVSDNGVGISNGRISEMEMGVGLTSTCGRLERMYGERHSFSIQPLAEGGTEVRIRLPFQSGKPADKATYDGIAHTDCRR